MKRLALILGFVVFWRQWEAVEHLGDFGFSHEVTKIDEHMVCGTLFEAREFVRSHKGDERYTDMHIYEIGREIK